MIARCRSQSPNWARGFSISILLLATSISTPACPLAGNETWQSSRLVEASLSPGTTMTSCVPTALRSKSNPY